MPPDVVQSIQDSRMSRPQLLVLTGLDLGLRLLLLSLVQLYYQCLLPLLCLSAFFSCSPEGS